MKRDRILTMVLYILVGAILGTILGVVLGKIFPAIDKSLSFGFTPFTLNLVFMNITLGIQFSLNVGTVIGVLLFLYLFMII
jgi:hypothetical protein